LGRLFCCIAKPNSYLTNVVRTCRRFYVKNLWRPVKGARQLVENSLPASSTQKSTKETAEKFTAKGLTDHETHHYRFAFVADEYCWLRGRFATAPPDFLCVDDPKEYYRGTKQK
jgi:hypothetical protein